jgi:hypothetical protein
VTEEAERGGRKSMKVMKSHSRIQHVYREKGGRQNQLLHLLKGVEEGLRNLILCEKPQTFGTYRVSRHNDKEHLQEMEV